MRNKTRTKIILGIILLLIVFLSSCNTGSGEDDNNGEENNSENGETGSPPDNQAYYVSVNGDDNNDGSESSPWKTLAKAAEALVAGNTLYIRGGTYNERLIPKNSGSAGTSTGTSNILADPSYIIYSAYKEETVTIDGKDISLPDDMAGLIEINNKKYIKISGLRVINAGPNDNNCGIYVESSSGIIIEKNYTYNTTSSGIGVWNSSNIIIDNNEVELACNDGEQECLTVAVTAGLEVKNNLVHHSGPGSIGGEGIDVKDGSSNGKIFGNIVHHINRLGLYVDSWDKHTYNIDVYQNIIYQCEDDGIVLAAENGGLLENIRVYNNIVYQNKYNGITTGDWGEANAAHPLKDIYIINNTIYNNGSPNWGGGISILNKETQNLVIRNNILSQNQIYQLYVEVSNKSFLTADFNLIDGYRGFDDEIYGNNYVTGNPLFIDAGVNDFHINTGSPAIDSASPTLAPSVDFDYITRPQGAGYDIGAYEYKEN